MAVLVRKPAKAIPYPPTLPAPRTVYTYRTGDSWKGIAKDHGFSDPWDLIFYNFQCRNPREVNWCMQEFFKCTVSHDGKNYSFSSSDTLRKIYIPPAGFKAFDTADADALQYVIDALQSPGVDGINIQVRGHKLDWTLFQDVLTHVQSQTILVFDMPESFPADVIGFYSVFDNSILVRNPSRKTISKTAAIIHECVHAGMDMRRMPVLHREGEACGSIAEAIFGLASSGADPNTFDPSTIVDSMARTAARIAKRALVHGLSNLSPFELTHDDADLKALELLITINPRLFKTAQLEMANDGV